MRDIHTIRLRGPWQIEPLAESTEAPPPARRVMLPTDWATALGKNFRGRVRCVRYFNAPPSLLSSEQVYLALDAGPADATLALNGQPLGALAAGQSARWPLNLPLAPRNELTIELHLPATSAPPSGLLVGEVRLEIETR